MKPREGRDEDTDTHKPDPHPARNEAPILCRFLNANSPHSGHK